MARAARLAVGAAHMALQDAGRSLPKEAGIFMGVGREPGSLDDILAPLKHSLDSKAQLSLERLAREGMSYMNPLSSLKTLPNMSLAHVAIQLGLMGPTQALCTDAKAGARALLEGATAILDGRCPLALAGAADSRVAFPERVAAQRLSSLEPLGEAAVFYLLEPLKEAQARGAKIYALVEPYDGAPQALPDLFGDCGAARALSNMAITLGQGGSSAFAPVALRVQPNPCAPALRCSRPEPVAISGLGLLSPLGREFDSFQRRLLSGERAGAAIKAFDARLFASRNACELDEQELLPLLPPELAEEMRGLDDRRGVLALLAALKAVQDHGALSAETGLSYGTGLSSLSFEELRQDCLPYLCEERGFDHPAFAQAAIPQNPQAPLRHRVARPLELLSHHLQLSGPQVTHFSACAAGAAAIAHGVDLIRRREAPMMLAGASDSMIMPFGIIPFILLRASSQRQDPRRAGLPFEVDREGFLMGEGGAFFLLEPLKQARAAGREIYGQILGSGLSCDAYSVTAPLPDGSGAELAMHRALKDAGLEPEDVDYINAHGTGTPLNDVAEAQAIRRLFGINAPPVSSSKAQMGHSIAAAGALELAACLASFAGERLPPNAGLCEPDPLIQLDLVGREGRAGAPSVILSNSFGFGGQNCCLLIGHSEWDR